MSVPFASLFIITSTPYTTSVPLYLKTWPKWLCVLSLALASTMLTLFYLEPLRKTSSNSRKHRTLPVLLPFLLNPAVHILSSSSSTGSPLSTALTSKQQTSFSILFIQPSWLIFVHPCMPVIPLVPSDSPTLISSLFRMSAHHLALAVSALQLLKSGTLSLYFSLPVPVPIPSVVTSRPTTASRPSSPLNPSPFAPVVVAYLNELSIIATAFCTQH